MPQENEKKPFAGSEERASFCPVHHFKCREIDDQKTELKTRLPIWAFTAFCIFLGSVLSYMNWHIWTLNSTALRQNEMVIIALNDHIDASNDIIRDGSKILMELGTNLRNVMKKLNLEFEAIPDYQLDSQQRK
jgi:hypothetical protein